MSTDFRAELECLVKAYDDHGLRWPDIDALAMYRAVQKARAALAAPEQGPTDEELYDCWMNVAEQARLLEHTLDQPAVTFARAVLARWGRPAVKPVPVAEGLPEPEDCDAEDKCWFFHTSILGGHEWFLNLRPKVSAWYRWQSVTHWLPHWALPLPQEGE